jgi:hypothetical protein
LEKAERVLEFGDKEIVIKAREISKYSDWEEEVR